MQQAHTGVRGAENRAKDIETWLANSLATILAAAAIVLGVIGLLVAFGYLNGDNSVNHFQDGMVWLVLGVISGIAANVFRREHHVVDANSGFRDTTTYRVSDEPSRTGSRIRE
jgi:H+/Cl- antiporter ClcA